MKIEKIKRLQKDAIKEAQIEVNKIFGKYSKQINELIAAQLPKGTILHSCNGICSLRNEEGEELKSGNYWSKFNNGDSSLEFIANLQYADELTGQFSIASEIRSSQ